MSQKKPSSYQVSPTLSILAFVLIFFFGTAWAEALKPLESSFFKPTKTITKQTFRDLYRSLELKDFEAKWSGSLNSPLHFFTSFPDFYYTDFKDRQNIGPIGICYGDAHLKNFGFLLFEEGTQFVFNDLDDSGYCPIAIDGLRFFVSLRLFGVSDKELIRFTDSYEAISLSREAPYHLDSSSFPNLKTRRSKILAEYTEDGRFILQDELHGISDAKRDQVRTALTDHLEMGRERVLDVCRYDHSEGGSAGLIRYWALLADKQGVTSEILELKEESEPATSRGHWKANPEPRIEWVTEDFWKGLTPRYYETLRMGEKTYLLRSRAFKNIQPEAVSSQDLKFFLKAELSLLAEQHAKTWKKMKPISEEQLARWMFNSSAYYATRIQAIFDQVGGEE